MKWIITAAISIIFVVTALTGLFNVGRLIETGFNALLDTGTCVWEPEKAETCSFVWDSEKRDVSEAAAIAIVTLPLALYTYRQLKVKVL